MDLDAFIAQHNARPWKWGETDCTLALADWGMVLGLPDIAAAWRGAYGSEAEWQRIVKDHGGLVPLVGEVCRLAGIEARPMARGCVGIIGARQHPDRQWGAIFDGQRWHIRGGEGFFPVSTFSPLGVWGL